MSIDLAMKMKQIQGLKSVFSNTQEIEKDSTFKITLTDKLSLFISLPVNFPASGPSYFIEGYSNHLSIPAPGSAWTIHNSLSSLTMSMFKQFSTNPQLLSDYESRLRSITITHSPPPPYNTQQQQQQQQHQQPNINNSGNIKSTTGSGGKSNPPPYKENGSKAISIPNSFPDLKNKSKEELEELLKSEEMFKAYLFQFDDVSKLSEDKEKLLKQSEVLTNKTDSIQKEIDAQRQKLEEQTKIYTDLNAEYLKLKEKKERFDKANSIPILLEKLSDLISQSEMESDSISQNFLDGNIDLKEFKKKFKETRARYHSRQMIKEKHIQIMSLNGNH